MQVSDLLETNNNINLKFSIKEGDDYVLETENIYEVLSSYGNRKVIRWHISQMFTLFIVI